MIHYDQMWWVERNVLVLAHSLMEVHAVRLAPQDHGARSLAPWSPQAAWGALGMGQLSLEVFQISTFLTSLVLRIEFLSSKATRLSVLDLLARLKSRFRGPPWAPRGSPGLPGIRSREDPSQNRVDLRSEPDCIPCTSTHKTH